jgi:IS66 C-terminal element/Transposase IS66 family
MRPFLVVVSAHRPTDQGRARRTPSPGRPGCGGLLGGDLVFGGRCLQLLELQFQLIEEARRSAAVFYYSRDRVGEHPQRHLSSFTGILQADGWDAFALFLGDGRICLSNNAAERGLRGIALGRKSWLFAGSDRGGERAALMYSLIVTAKMNDIDHQAWLADVLARIADHPARKLDDLLPWNWKTRQADAQVAA